MIFQYAHLLKGSIRLVRFHPDSTPARVSLILEHEPRWHDRNIHFTALVNEAQGSFGDMDEVLLQGRTRRVPRTLWQALSALVEHHDTSGRFWVEYVCVNQNNEGEKMDHSARQPSIYAAADEVLLWLGAADAVAGASQEVEINGMQPCGRETSLRSSKDSAFSQSTLHNLQLQQAKRLVLLQGKDLVELWKSDTHSAL